MRHYRQVVVAAASMTVATCRTKHDKPINYVGDWNGGTVVVRQTGLSISLFGCTQEHQQVTIRSHQGTTRRSIR